MGMYAAIQGHVDVLVVEGARCAAMCVDAAVQAHVQAIARAVGRATGYLSRYTVSPCRVRGIQED